MKLKLLAFVLVMSLPGFCTGVLLTWQAPSPPAGTTLSGYCLVKGSSVAGITWPVAGGLTEPFCSANLPASPATYLDTGVFPGSTYWYAVAAYFADNITQSQSISKESNFVSVTIASSTPPTANFIDNFDTGALNARWVRDGGNAPARSSVNDGSFDTTYCDLSQGMLDLKVTQTGSSPVVSKGCEVMSVGVFGYGTFTWKFRASSTATTPSGAGSVTSGQISTGFGFLNGTPYSEADVPEIEGQFPTRCEFTNWTAPSPPNSYTPVTCTAPDQAQHEYKLIWTPGRMDYYIDGTLKVTHTTFVPSAPMHIMVSHYGTNGTNFGGLASSGTTRHMYVSQISYSSSTVVGGPQAPGAPTGVTATLQ